MSNQWFYNPHYPPPPVPYFNSEYSQQNTSNTWNNGVPGPYVVPTYPLPASFNVPPPGFQQTPAPHSLQQQQQSSCVSQTTFNSSYQTSSSKYSSRSDYARFSSHTSASGAGYSYSDELESYKNSKASLEKEVSAKRFREDRYTSRSRNRYSRRSRLVCHTVSKYSNYFE